MVNIRGPTFAASTQASSASPNLTADSSPVQNHSTLRPAGCRASDLETNLGPEEFHLPKIFWTFSGINPNQHGSRKDRSTIPFDGSDIAEQPRAAGSSAERNRPISTDEPRRLGESTCCSELATLNGRFAPMRWAAVSWPKPSKVFSKTPQTTERRS